MYEHTIFAIRAHYMNDHLRRILLETRNRTRHRVILLLHDEQNSGAPDCDVLYFSSGDFQKDGLSTFEMPRWAWYLGDYPIYKVFDQFPQCEYLYMADFDAKINASIDDLFANCVGKFHFVAAFAGFSNPQWRWHASATRWFSDPRGSYFPVIGVSRDLASLAKDKRRRISDDWLQGGRRSEEIESHMINCEAFMPSVCAENNLPMTDLRNIVPGWVDRYFVGFGIFPWDFGKLDSVPVIHPCLPREALESYLVECLRSEYISIQDKKALRVQAADIIMCDYLNAEERVAFERILKENPKVV